jgi:hypothetical protein
MVRRQLLTQCCWGGLLRRGCLQLLLGFSMPGLMGYHALLLLLRQMAAAAAGRVKPRWYGCSTMQQ